MEDVDLTQAVHELQRSVAALEQRNKDLVLKLQLFSTRAESNWGWDRFASEPEFWENIFDSGLADCQGRCITNLQESYAACDRNHQKYSPEWHACNDEARARSVACQRACSGAHPVVP
jgi:hypothetical protein